MGTMRIAAALGACAAAAVLAAGIVGAVEPVEPPPPTADIVVGAGPGAPGGHVRVFDGTTIGLLESFFAFPGFTGGVDVAAGDVNGDGVADLVVGSGLGAAHVKMIDGLTHTERASFFAFPGLTGGVRVAVGDVNGDGRADIVVGAGAGAPGGHVRVFDGATLELLQSFFAFPGFAGGVDVAAGDVDGDGRADVVVGSGAGGSQVKVIDGRTGSDRYLVLPFPGFTGGVNVAAGDVNGDGRADIVVGAGPGAPGGHVKVFDGSTLVLIQSFFAFDGFSGGVDVAAGDVDGDGYADVVVGTGPGAAGGHVKVFDGASSVLRASFFSFEGFTGGIRVAARPGARSAEDPDSDGDGIPDASDPDTVAEAVLDLSQDAFAAKGHPKATLARLAGIEALILAGDVDEAIAELEALRRRLDGCPATATSPEAADRNDWIVDCDAQRAVRAAIDGVLAALGSG